MIKDFGLKDFGLKFDEIKDDLAYLFGLNSPLPKEILCANRNWDKYLPTYEPQFNSFFDTYGCTVFGTLNVFETMLKRLLNHEYNFAERFPYILANITPPGADPHRVCEVIRKNGVVEEKDLPMTPSFQDYLKPKPMTPELLIKASGFPYQLKHEYLWYEVIDPKKMRTLIEENLQYSPLGVSVTAWIKGQDGTYVDNGQGNTHWCVLYGISDNGYLIFDSYDQSKKILNFNHKIQICKRYHLAPKDIPDNSWWGKVVRDNLLKTNIELLTNLIKKLTDKMNINNASNLLYGTAKALIGQNLAPSWQPLACAASMSYIVRKAFGENLNLIHTSNWETYLTNSPKWEKVNEPEPYCVILVNTDKLPKINGIEHGHIGIVGKFDSPDGTKYTMSNNSETYRWDTHLSLKDWENYWVKKGGGKITYWRRLIA